MASIDSPLGAGQLVEVVGRARAVSAAEHGSVAAGLKDVGVGEKRGQVVGWDEQDVGRYIVETFDADLVAVEPEHLQEYRPPTCREGGFDFAFPRSAESFEAFVQCVADILLQRPYCVVQMAVSPSDRRCIAGEAASSGRWSRLPAEFESQYMGRSPRGKKMQWTTSHRDDAATDAGGGGGPGPPGSVVPGGSGGDGFAVANQLLADVAATLMSACPALGFEGFSCTSGMLHAACRSASEEEGLLEELEADQPALSSDEIRTHLSFSQRRKLCMVYFVRGGGGTLTLHPAGARGEDLEIRCRENQLVVFRHDQGGGDYTYSPGDAQELAVQAWVLRPPQAGEGGMAFPVDLLQHAEDFERIPLGPSIGSIPETVDCMSLATRYPAACQTAGQYWSLLSTGTDGIITIPATRWDHDVYTCTADNFQPGKTYSSHFGMLQTCDLMDFDNEFFGLTREETYRYDPISRVLLEIGYDCLYRGGWTRKKLNSAEVVAVMGATEGEFANTVLSNCGNTISEDQRLCLLPCVMASRLQYTFGIVGPTMTVETACSSALSATAIMHGYMRTPDPEQLPWQRASAWRRVGHGLAWAGNAAHGPFTMISFCSAHMLSLNGRCFTFDQCADGFARGEGAGAMHYKVSGGGDLARLAMLCGSNMNEDGRSASLTAPNGPSQQACIKGSLREAGILPLDIQIQELHGTGTALGDPIEVGSLRATMMEHEGVVRSDPLVKTSSKSNFGHTELTAGMCGIMKCVLLGVSCCAVPNCHFRLLNPHIDSNGYPVLFASECVDQGKNVGYCGVSSFGWAGSNARGDIWTRCQSGPRNTQPGRLPLDLSAERVSLWHRATGDSEPRLGGGPGEDCGAEDLGAFTGCYLTGAPVEPGEDLFLRGSFNGWGPAEAMVWREELDAYSFSLALGETGVEQFQLCVEANEELAIFPASKMAGHDALVLGPGKPPPGHRWVIDGHEDRRGGPVQGAVYSILFRWDAAAKRKRIHWELATSEEAVQFAARHRFRHGYTLRGSWNLWKPVKMRALPGRGAMAFESSVKLGLYGAEEFHFLRDDDPLQRVYPARARATQSDVPVCGPDNLGRGKNWALRGATGESVRIELRVWDGDISVATTSSRGGRLVWTRARPLEMGGRYYVMGSWNNFGFTPMLPEPGGGGVQVHRMRARLVGRGFESFQIVVDEDPRRAIHPEMRLTDQLLSPALGPDAKGEGLYWGVLAAPGATLEVTFDPSQEDRRRVVTWTISEGSPGA